MYSLFARFSFLARVFMTSESSKKKKKKKPTGVVEEKKNREKKKKKKKKKTNRDVREEKKTETRLYFNINLLRTPLLSFSLSYVASVSARVRKKAATFAQ